MRYASVYPAASRQARSRRIGRCALCHAPVLSDEEHYGTDAGVVHGACRLESADAERPAGPPAPRPAPLQARRTRRVASSLGAPSTTGRA